MRLDNLLLTTVLVVLVCGCEGWDGVSQEVQDQANYAIENDDPYSCYHLKTEADINWCLNKFSGGTNTTGGCKLILNKTYSNNCVKDVAVASGDWSKCADSLSYLENAKCRITVLASNALKASDGGGESQEGTEQTTETQPPSHIQVEGDSAFTAETNKALKLLAKTKEYSEITHNIGKIKEFDKSGMNVYGEVPTFQVGKATWEGDPVWYAGTIAHDSYHAKLYNEAKLANGGAEPDANTWTGAEAEKKCLGYQIKVLTELKADPDTIESLKKQQKEGPKYQDIPYENRSW
jgi:hypothetical protein